MYDMYVCMYMYGMYVLCMHVDFSNHSYAGIIILYGTDSPSNSHILITY